ncbi:hypothetical protein SARC_06767 [Sphaeroforma arctica JP610]|uniref:Uncharacterized protein n=1 Tax=Sphaeroforma arctica JP610 TaxID=667725 RepID=A0A0L0FVK4_9EUKA|nr:hypothetical protein SARC_06767 [Sphaeroforma arctica JP610]KNC80885.1 hypothetical protein SARC_06767 [Sphaeroforma arctica JP610]|eukprot:XP_014154787.1 hypothetical protein SARC_06767 [Sphaeroforma arctica JP610]
MVHIDAVAEIKLPAAEYWSVRNTKEFLAIECKYLNNASKYCLEETLEPKTGRLLHQSLQTTPDLSIVPPFLLSMLPGEKGIVLTDSIDFNLNDPLTPYAFTATTVPSVFYEKADIVGYTRIVPSKDNRTCTQTVSMDVKVNQWGVGGLVETLISNGIYNAYKQLPKMVDDWKQNCAADVYERSLQAHSDREKLREKERKEKRNQRRRLSTKSSSKSLGGDSWCAPSSASKAEDDSDNDSLYSTDSLYFDPDNAILVEYGNGSHSETTVDSGVGVEDDEIRKYQDIPLTITSESELVESVMGQRQSCQPGGVSMSMSSTLQKRDSLDVDNFVGTQRQDKTWLNWMSCSASIIPSCF